MKTRNLSYNTLRGIRAVAGVAALAFSASAFSAATIVIQNINGPNVGFNDPTPAAPIGGNSGTTLGQQRLIAFAAAAAQWGATLTSSQNIIISAQFTPLTCTATSAVLGSAGANNIWRDFPGAVQPATWYPQALANKLSGTNLGAGNQPGDQQDINANFNSNLGQVNCLTGTFFYLGLDNNHGANIDLVTVLLHEFGHGLGFQTFTSGSTGAEQNDGTGPKPSIWDFFLLDTSTSKWWYQMTNAERVTSALNSGHLVWSGATVTTAVPAVLAPGTPIMTVSAPASVAGAYQIGAASFGPALGSPGVTGEVMPVVDTAPNLGLACDPLSAANALAVNGKIALVDRGVCTFVVKVKNAQNAGAIGVLVADNAAGSPPAGLGGTDPTIVIPSVRITQADGITLKAALATRSRGHSGMFANIGVNLAVRAGADPAGRALLFAPNPYQSGSSVSHYDTSAFPNLLMEPAINGDLQHAVIPPIDLTFPLLQDIGW